MELFPSLPIDDSVSFPISIVETPFGNYMVIEHTNEQYAPTGTWRDNRFEAGGTYSLAIPTGIWDKTKSWLRYMRSMEDIEIEEDTYPGPEDFSEPFRIPKTTLHHALSSQFIKEKVDEYHSKYVEIAKELKKISNSSQVDDLLDRKTAEQNVPFFLAKTLWHQLVRRSAPHHLVIEHHTTLSRVHYTDEGFLVSDGGNMRNNGHGISETYMYKTFTKDSIPRKEFVFPYKNMHISQAVEGYLTYSLRNLNKDYAEKHGIIANIGSRSAFVSFDRDAIREEVKTIDTQD